MGRSDIFCILEKNGSKAVKKLELLDKKSDIFSKYSQYVFQGKLSIRDYEGHRRRRYPYVQSIR